MSLRRAPLGDAVCCLQFCHGELNMLIKLKCRVSFTGVYIRIGRQHSLGVIVQNDLINNQRSVWEVCVRGDSGEAGEAALH